MRSGLLFIALLLSCHSLCAAQDAPKPSTPKSVPSAYKIGADDVLEISVTNHSDLNRTLTVLPDGKITFPEVGEITVAGKSPAEVGQTIQAALEKTRNNVVVLVAVKEIHSLRVRILGAVRSPSAYDLRPGWKLMDVVAVAGGLNGKPALSTGRLIRKSGEVLDLDVAKAIAEPAGKANLALEPEDLILIDQVDAAKNQVHVVGQVAKPGAYDLQDGMNLLTLISLAGNATDKAALSKSYVLRTGKSIPIDLHAPVVQGIKAEPALQFKLEANDVLFVPELEGRVAVMGSVSKPGFFAIPEKGAITALSAFNLAGGIATGGDASKSVVIRHVDGKPVVIPFNVDKILKSGDLGKDVNLQANDIVYVPTRSNARPFGINDLLNPLSALTLLGLRVFR